MFHFLKRHRFLLALLLVLGGCTPVLIHQMNELYGQGNPFRYDQPMAPKANAVEFHRDIQPILESRCVVCHGCYDAPCQLNLTSWEGLGRGANPDQVYTNRILATDPTRLLIDAQLPSQWRQKNFHPVLNERQNSTDANLEGSALFRLLELKRRHPLAHSGTLDEATFDFSLNRKQQCPVIEKMDDYERDHQEWGMPFGLPGLSPQEHHLIRDWLASGAPVAASPALPDAINQSIGQWETFFNGSNLQARLVSRYLYEHLFLAHIYFGSDASEAHPHFFRLVRSTTAPGNPIQEIPTRHPYDDPGTEHFWYRLRLDNSSVIDKTHMPYRLDNARLQQWKNWFIRTDYSVTRLPDYSAEQAANPFTTFAELPVKSRYLFLLSEAHFVIENFIKGPVCRGQIALGVIDEHFWVFFINPDQLSVEESPEFLAQEAKRLRLPAEDQTNAILTWLEYSRQQKRYLDAKTEYLKASSAKQNPLQLSLVWNGSDTDAGSYNDNAALTVFRHTDSASVLKGMVGSPPKTSWLLGYSLLERIHYLLVAGFDIYGSIGHQLTARLYMDFLRMEAESNFLSLLPKADREATRDYWYRDASNNVQQYLYDSFSGFTVDSSIEYHTRHHQAELYQMLQAHLQQSLSDRWSLNRLPDQDALPLLTQLQGYRGTPVSFLPQISLVEITHPKPAPATYITLINNTGYTNISELFNSEKRRKPEEDYLTVLPGIAGAYPNAFFHVEAGQLKDFCTHIKQLKSESDYSKLVTQYGVRRTSEQFWAYSDRLQQYYRRENPVTGGILDYNRLENR